MSLTVGKALTLLRLIAQAEQPLGLLQLAERSHFDKSTVARLLAPLTEHQLISRSTEKRYALGAGLFTLSTSFIRRHDIHRLAQPHLQRIRDATRETVTFHLLMQDARVCLDGIESPEDVRRGVPLGEVQPLHEGPTGKVILAFLPPLRQAAILKALAIPVGSLAELRRQLALAMIRGFMVATDDRAYGVSGLSAPVFNNDGIYGSITVAGPKDRWTPARMEAYAPAFVWEVGQLSNALGGSASPVPPTVPDRTVTRRGTSPSRAHEDSAKSKSARKQPGR